MAVGQAIQGITNNLQPESNLKSTKRFLILEKIPGKETLASSSIVDKRLFEGETKLIAEQDDQFSLWSVKYSNGILPLPLQQRFTSFPKLFDFCSKYFETRGIRIATVID
ncbi:MAG TPA: hypothetical protein VEP90_26135 [Methylomirabilota bacterium]|nr:hypothetical protein [Methylomirabilota bacterium]